MLTKLKNAVKILLYVRNWPPVIWHALLFKKKVTAHFRSGFSMEVDTGTFEVFAHNMDFFRYFRDGKIEAPHASITYKGKRLTFNYGHLEPFSLGEVFGWGSYDPFTKEIDFSNRVVVDIGAAFGDTVVYFAALGAKKVVAIEPVQTLFKLTEENIALNKLGAVCDAVYAGVGKAPLADISLDPTFRMVFGGYAPLRSEFDSSVAKVPVITLDSLAEKYMITDGVLKIDCEGWEYDILESASDELLRKFEYFIVEYHYGYETLENRFISAGFEVTHTEPAHIHVPERQGKYADMYVGMLFAKRK